ncbi:MAG: YdiY family protein [Halomonas sp.]
MRTALGLTLFILALCTGGQALASPFYAPPPPDEDADTFSGETELGYTRLAGNTDSRTLIAKGRLAWLNGDWTHTLRGKVRNAARDGETSAEQYLLSGRERYSLEGPHYLFGFARWEKDRFSGYDWQATTIGGYGRDLLEGKHQRLSVEAGPGYRHDRLGREEDSRLGVGYAALDWELEATETTTLGQELSVEATDDNTTSRSHSSLTAKLNSRLSLRLSHEMRHNSRPPEDAEARTDHTSSAALLYDW